MKKASLYILLILTYLTLSKSLSPQERKMAFVNNASLLPYLFTKGPVTVIHKGHTETGNLIKTHYIHLRAIGPFGLPRDLTLRIDRKFWKKYRTYIGMSIYRKGEKAGEESLSPAPPGVLFLGDRTFGRWRLRRSGIRTWEFHRGYGYLPRLLGWGSFRPGREFARKAQQAQTNAQVYRGEKGFYFPADTYKKKRKSIHRRGLEKVKAYFREAFTI